MFQDMLSIQQMKHILLIYMDMDS